MIYHAFDCHLASWQWEFGFHLRCLYSPLLIQVPNHPRGPSVPLLLVRLVPSLGSRYCGNRDGTLLIPHPCGWQWVCAGWVLAVRYRSTPMGCLLSHAPFPSPRAPWNEMETGLWEEETVKLRWKDRRTSYMKRKGKQFWEEVTKNTRTPSLCKILWHCYHKCPFSASVTSNECLWTSTKSPNKHSCWMISDCMVNAWI